MISIDQVRRRAELDAKNRGCYLNPDEETLEHLLEGLRENEERYGYPSCPCRLACYNFEIDRDIICPCDYRDPDVEEFGACYCTLYVSGEVYEGKKTVEQIPERRPVEKQNRVYSFVVETSEESSHLQMEISMKLYYCRQCGYVVFREDPPYVCPICRAKQEMFSKITNKF